MRENDEIYLKMFRSVKEAMDKNKPVWESNPIITNCYNILACNIKSLEDADVILTRKPNGITVNKKILRKELNLLAYLIKEALRLYYSINGPSEDMQLLTYPKSKLQKMLEDTFYLEACRISQLSITLATEIAPFGITLLMIDKLKDGLSNFTVLTPQRDKIKIKYAATVKQIPVTITETRLMLKNILDPLISIYQFDSPKFFSVYKSSRKRMLKPGKHKHFILTITGKVTQAETLVAMSEVIVLAGKKKKTTITDSKGIYKIKIYKKDADIVTFSHEEFETLILNIPKEHTKNEVTLNASLVSNIKIEDIDLNNEV